jgi:F0F1-type ATP synthase assembly protein I
MLLIELFGWILSLLLLVGFIGSLLFVSRKPTLLSKSDYDYSQKSHQDSSSSGKGK